MVRIGDGGWPEMFVLVANGETLVFGLVFKKLSAGVGKAKCLRVLRGRQAGPLDLGRW